MYQVDEYQLLLEIPEHMSGLQVRMIWATVKGVIFKCADSLSKSIINMGLFQSIGRS
jgi:hypothetical protein